MAVRITGNTTAASVSQVKARASISVETPIAGVYAQIPVVAVSYIDLTISAELDTSGRYRLVVDSVNLADGTSLRPGKLFKDQFGTTDSATRGVGKVLNDPVTPFEDLRYSMAKKLQDSYGLTDAHAISFATSAASLVVSGDTTVTHAMKSLSDAFGAIDGDLQFSVMKVLNDLTAATDLLRIDTDKHLNDAPEISDQPVKDLSKQIAESFELLDSAAFGLDKSLADTTFSTDNFQRVAEYVRALQDAVGINDNAGVGDGLALTFNTVIANVYFVSDAQQLAAGLGKQDSITTSDAGTLVSQGYCDLTYFAEDYVGTRQTF